VPVQDLNFAGADKPSEQFRRLIDAMSQPLPEEPVRLTLETADIDADMEVEADFVPSSELQDAQVQPVVEAPDEFQRDSVAAQEAFDAAKELAGESRFEEAVVEFTRAAKIAEMAHEWHLAAVACKQVGDFYADDIPPYDLQRAFRMYRRAVAAYEACGLFNEARDLGYHQIRLKMSRGRELNLSPGYRAMLWLEWAVAGFGYRPERVVAFNFILILLYAAIYLLAGGVRSTLPQFPAESLGSRWLNSVYFSGVTFLTVGYGDFVPSPHIRLIALSEAFIGFFMMGLFVAVLANRLSKH
jgi:hypothetical protein